MPRFVRAWVATAIVMLVLDLTWLGLVAASLYDRALGPLKAPEVNGVAAGLFYGMYVTATVIHGALPASNRANAVGRGAGLGFAAYATYELTNWAVIADWPGWLVPIDIVWGMFLTGAAAAAGRWVAGPAPA